MYNNQQYLYQFKMSQNTLRHINNDQEKALNKDLQPQNIQVFDYFAAYRNNTGIIRSHWYNINGKLQLICYGTGYAISKRLVLTCAHSIFQQKSRRLCQSVAFVPNIISGQIQNTQPIYKSAKSNFIDYQKINQKYSYDTQLVKQDFALILMEQDMDIKNFPIVGVDSQYQINQNTPIQISGFPSRNYYGQVKWNCIKYQREILNGKYIRIQDYKIYHKLSTKTGHSGGPILGLNNSLQVVLLGIHTHKGTNYNSGLFFNRQILQKLALYQHRFTETHGIKKTIGFPIAIHQLFGTNPDQIFLNRIEAQRNYEQFQDLRQMLKKDRDIIPKMTQIKRIVEQIKKYQKNQTMIQKLISSSEYITNKLSQLNQNNHTSWLHSILSSLLQKIKDLIQQFRNEISYHENTLSLQITFQKYEENELLKYQYPYFQKKYYDFSEQFYKQLLRESQLTLNGKQLQQIPSPCGTQYLTQQRRNDFQIPIIKIKC